MRLFGLALAAGLTLLPAAASADVPRSLPTDTELRCVQTLSANAPGLKSWRMVKRGVLHLDTQDGAPSGYTYVPRGRVEPAPSGTGGWSLVGGEVRFDSGPLARPAEGWSIAGRSYDDWQGMPHDRNKFRSFPLVLRSLTDQPAEEAPSHDESSDPDVDSYWYCGVPGVNPRRYFARQLKRAHRRSHLPVLLPGWVAPGFVTNQQRFVGSLPVLRRGAWRFAIGRLPCETQQRDVCNVAWLGAHRLRPGAARYRSRHVVRLRDGKPAYLRLPRCGRRWNVSFAVVVCGAPVIAWTRSGVEYSIQMRGAARRQLIAYASQTVREVERAEPLQPAKSR